MKRLTALAVSAVASSLIVCGSAGAANASSVVGDLLGDINSHTTSALDAHVTAVPSKPYPNSVVSMIAGDINADAHDNLHTVTDITPVPGTPG